MTADSIMVAIALFTPLVGAGLIAFLGRWPNLREAVSLLTAVSSPALFLTSSHMLSQADHRPLVFLKSSRVFNLV